MSYKERFKTTLGWINEYNIYTFYSLTWKTNAGLYVNFFAHSTGNAEVESFVAQAKSL